MTHKRIEHFSGSESMYSAQSMLAPPPYTSQTSLDQMQKGQNANYINGRIILKITLLKLKMERNTETKYLRKPEVVTYGKFHSPVIGCKQYLPLDRSFLRNVKPNKLFCLLNHLSQTPFPSTFLKTFLSNSTKMALSTPLLSLPAPKSLQVGVGLTRPQPR